MALDNTSSASNPNMSTGGSSGPNGGSNGADTTGTSGHYYEDHNSYSNGYRGSYRGHGRYRDSTSYRGRGSGSGSGNRGGTSSDGYYRGYYGGERRGGYQARGGRYGSGYYGGREGGRGGYGSYSNNRESYTPPDHRGSDSSPEVPHDATPAEEVIHGGEGEEARGASAGYHESSGAYRGHRGSYRGRGSFRGGSGGYYYDSKYSANEAKGSTPRHYKDTIVNDKLKTFKNPWINIMGIQDETTQTKLESRFNDLSKVDKEIINLQKAKLKLESDVSNLDKQAAREELHVQLTTEKLEEFTYL